MVEKKVSLSARENTIDNVLRSPSQMLVPDYQREYAWGERQWNDLWEDTSALLNGRDTHFLGSSVVIEHTETDPKRLELVDGQQRFTTISIILAAIRHRYEQADNYEAQTEMVDDYLKVRDSNGDSHLKLELTKYDQGEFEKILDGEIEEVQDSRVKEAYEFYSQKLSELSIEEVDELRKELVNSMSLVTIECDSETSAFRLFESLNNKGLDLSPVDLMKNHLFKKATEDDDVDKHRVKDLWDEILGNIRPRLGQPNRFFRHYLMSTPRMNLEQAVSKTRLYDVFKEVVDVALPQEGISLEEFIEDMAEKSDLYIDIIDSDVNLYNNRYNKKVNRKLADVQIKNKQVRTLLLRLSYELDDPEQMLEALSIVEVYNMRVGVTDAMSGSIRDRVWSSLCSRMFQNPRPNEFLKETLRSKAPSDDEFRGNLLRRNFPRNDRTKYLLEKLETEHFMRTGLGKRVEDRSVVDIEHIAPRKAFQAKKYSSWQQYLNLNSSQFDEYKDRLGNLTLLENKINRRASDNPFQQKKGRYENSDFDMTRSVTQYAEWSAEAIEERSEELAEAAVRIWSLENV
jgi:hypothetical protein